MEKKNKQLTSFEEYLDENYGPIGTEKRTEFEIKAQAFALGEKIKEERRLSHPVPQDL
jgi:hypothetical protein